MYEYGIPDSICKVCFDIHTTAFNVTAVKSKSWCDMSLQEVSICPDPTSSFTVWTKTECTSLGDHKILVFGFFFLLQDYESLFDHTGYLLFPTTCDLVFNLACKTEAVMLENAAIFSSLFTRAELKCISEAGKTPHHILFLPLSVAGYQLTSAECFDLRSNRVVADQYCHYYPENIKPKPKLQECNLDPCPAR